MSEIKYSGYYCNKCNYIPLIKIIPKINEIKVFSSCKCNKQYENIDTFLKNKYRNNITNSDTIIKESPNNSHNQLEFDKSKIESILEKFNKEKLKIVEEGINIKNQLIDIFNKKIKEVNEMFLKYSEKNNKIFIILEQLIKSYELMKDNKSNILNVLNNCQIKENIKVNYFQKYKDLESLTKEIENYFNNKYIISNLDTSMSLENIYSYYSSNRIKNIIELDNDLCAYCSEMSNKISFIDFKKSEKILFTFKAHTKNIEHIFKSNMNNIISFGKEKKIKIWPIIDENYIAGIKEKNINLYNTNKTNFKEKEIEINLNPILEYDLEKEENIIKIIGLKDNKFLIAFMGNSFLLYKYSINNIELIQNYEYKNQNISFLFDVFIIQRENNEILALNNDENIHFLELNDFKFIKSLTFRYMQKNSLIQINSKEILIADGYTLKLIDLNNFNIKLTVKNEDKKIFLLNLNDGTFIQSTGIEIKRYFIKTMEELPLFDKIIFEDNYDDELDFNNYDNFNIYYLYQLNSDKIISCYNNGRFTLSYLKYN